MLAGVVVVFSLPYSESVVVAATDEGVGHAFQPLYVLDIFSVTLQDCVTGVVVASVVEFPHPDVLVSAAGGDLSVIIPPAHGLHLAHVSFESAEEFVLLAFLAEDPDGDGGIEGSAGNLVPLPAELDGPDGLGVLGVDC